MARAKIYLELIGETALHEKLFTVKRVIGTMRHLPGDSLTKSDVKFLISMPNTYEVIIDKRK